MEIVKIVNVYCHDYCTTFKKWVNKGRVVCLWKWLRVIKHSHASGSTTLLTINYVMQKICLHLFLELSRTRATQRAKAASVYFKQGTFHEINALTLYIIIYNAICISPIILLFYICLLFNFFIVIYLWWLNKHLQILFFFCAALWINQGKFFSVFTVIALIELVLVHQSPTTNLLSLLSPELQ